MPGKLSAKKAQGAASAAPEVSTKSLALAATLAKFLKKEYDSDVVLGDDTEEQKEQTRSFIPLPVSSITKSIGIPGIPTERVTSISGPEGVGKTTLMMMLAASAQRLGGAAIWFDAETAFNPARAIGLGVALDAMPVDPDRHAEQVLDKMSRIARRQARKGNPPPMVMIVDSVMGLITTEELKAKPDAAERPGSPIARTLSRKLRSLTDALRGSNIAAVFTNQVRDSVGVMWGPPTHEPGGRALKFFASLRLELSPRGRITVGKSKDKKGKVIGQRVQFQVTKNRFAPPFQSSKFKLYFDTRGVQSDDEEE